MVDNLGDFIKNLRINKGYSVEELANISGYSSVQIRNIESNKCKPQISKLKQLANALDCDYEILYEFVAEC